MVNGEKPRNLPGSNMVRKIMAGSMVNTKSPAKLPHYTVGLVRMRTGTKGAGERSSMIQDAASISTRTAPTKTMFSVTA